MKYYTLKKILKKKATYNIIIGERSNGKTYSALYHGLKEYFENGKQLAIIRRWKEDIRGKRASAIFKALVNDGVVDKLTNGEYEGIHYYTGNFYPCNYDSSGKAIYSDTNILGYTFALSDNEHNKSVAYPEVATIIFDEFLTNKLYLHDEFVLFMNTLSTIIRNRDNVKIFMLGNTVNKYCPYFKEMGLDNIPTMEQGEIDLYRYGDSDLTVAVEYCTSLKMFKKSNFYFAFDNPKLNMITGGTWELDIYPHLPVKYKPKNILLEYFILFNDDIFQANIIEVENEFFTYIHKKTTELKNPENDLIYTLEYNHKLNYNRNIYKPTSELQEKILWFYKTDRVFYQDNSVGDSINNYLKICKRG